MMRTRFAIQSGSSTAILIIVLVVFLSAGCASTRMEQVDPSDAATKLKKGDEIEITRSNGGFVSLKVDEVTATEVIAEDTEVPIDDIVAITKYVRGPAPHAILPNEDSEAKYLWGWVGAIVVLALIF